MTLWPLYRLASHAVAPLLPFYLKRRLSRGKEHATRLPERFGHVSKARPNAHLLWVHAASVGEMLSVLPLLDMLLKRKPEWQALITTGTVTSATLTATRLHEMGLSSRAFHQFIPVDTPVATARFLAHWRPDAALWLESEFWPNLLFAAQKHGVSPVLINARLSHRSFNRWRHVKNSIAALLRCFSAIYAQSSEDAKRLEALANHIVVATGNLKYDAPPLPADAQAMKTLLDAIGGRSVWVAASTHAGEEKIILAAHRIVRSSIPDALLILIPRHSVRGNALRELCEREGWQVTQRSRSESIASEAIHIADTMGELGLFYRLDAPVFIGGSLVLHGGQNPLEAARLGRPVITGPHTHNFCSIISEMKEAGVISEAATAEALAEAVIGLLISQAAREALGEKTAAFAAHQRGVAERLMESILPVLDKAELTYARP